MKKKIVHIQTIQLPLFLLDTCAFPGQLFPMHIFEPRYRLMMRRCMAGNKRFGLVNCKRGSLGAWEACEIGTCLEISNIKLLHDGRSYISTKGERRFKIKRQWDCDGYKMGEIEWIEDLEEDLENITQEIQSLRENFTKILLSQELNQSMNNLIQAINELSLDNLNPTEFVWALIDLIPLPTQLKQYLLSMQSLKQRIETLKQTALNYNIPQQQNN